MPVPIAIISHVLTPYRLHAHLRIVREMPEVALHSVFTHDQPDQPWNLGGDPEAARIRVVAMGRGHAARGRSHPRFIPRDWRKGGRIIEYLRQEGIRAVVMCGYSDAARLRVLRWCRRARVPVLLFNDGNIRSEKGGWWRGAVKRLVLPRIFRSCAVCMPCGTLGAALFGRYGVSAERIVFWPYEPDYALWENLSPAALEAARARFALEAGRRRIVFCGRMIHEKRPDLAAGAFAAIAADRPAWDLVMVGDGPERAGVEFAVPPELRPRVRWLGFVGEPALIAAVERLSDVLIVPSAYEPWGLVVNEACAAGMAVVSSDAVGAAAELVRDGVNGRLVPAGDAAALARALREVTEPGVIDRMKAASGGVLGAWRARADPVEGLRRALVLAGALAPRSG